MTTEGDKPTPQPRRKPASQPTLISNYFKRIESPTEKRRPPSPASVVILEGRPRSPAFSIDVDEHVPKRARLSTPPAVGDLKGASEDGELNALTELIRPKVKEFRPPPESPRTARYKYIPSSPATTNNNVTSEELAKMKYLHEKFVAKLGRPESIDPLRKLSQSESQMEEDEESDEEEEPPAASKTLRGKYATPQVSSGKKGATKKASSLSTVKFTPLERQYVEIKKQYPDTLLLIEVGYKFRFFGEDARVLPLWSRLTLDCFEGVGHCAFYES